VRSAKFIDEANKERYIEHSISVKRQKFFGHLTEDTLSQHTDYRGINIFLVKRVLKAWKVYCLKEKYEWSKGFH